MTMASLLYYVHIRAPLGAVLACVCAHCDTNYGTRLREAQHHKVTRATKSDHAAWVVAKFKGLSDRARYFVDLRKAQHPCENIGLNTLLSHFHVSAGFAQ
jgi:hypothetical protein